MKIKLDHIETIVVRKAKGWFKGIDIAELFEEMTAHPAEAYSDYHIYEMCVRTCTKVLTPDELGKILLNPGNDLLVDRKSFNKKSVSHGAIYNNMMRALQWVLCERYEEHPLNDKLRSIIEEERKAV